MLCRKTEHIAGTGAADMNYPPYDKNTKTVAEVLGTGKVEIECYRAVSSCCCCCCFTGTISISERIFEPRERQIKGVMSKST